MSDKTKVYRTAGCHIDTFAGEKFVAGDDGRFFIELQGHWLEEALKHPDFYIDKEEPATAESEEG